MISYFIKYFSVELVNLEMAKKLKSQGYKKPCEFFYLEIDLPFVKKGLKQTKNGKKMNHNRFDEFIYSAPTTQEAFDFVIGSQINYLSGTTITLNKK